jgi:hypothetical protein
MMSSLVSRPEVFCWALEGHRSRWLRLLVGQIPGPASSVVRVICQGVLEER